MSVLKFTRQQYKNYNKAASDVSALLKTARTMKSQQEKIKVISKTYSMAKAVFEKIRQENRDYKPKSLFGRIVKSMLLSFLNLGLKVNISGMRRFLIAFPVAIAPAPQPKRLPPVLPPVAKPQEPVITGSLLMLDQGNQPAVKEPEVQNPEPKKPDPFAHLNPFENGKLKPEFVFKNNY